MLSEARCTQYLPATFGMSWEKSGVLKPDRIHRSGDTTKIPAAEPICADLCARTAAVRRPRASAHMLILASARDRPRTPLTTHSCFLSPGARLAALCLPQADVIEEDCARKLGHIGVFWVERAVNATPRVHGMQPASRQTGMGLARQAMPGHAAKVEQDL